MAGKVHPQKKKDDRSFPVRLFIYLPREGFGKDWNDLYPWLDEHIGRPNYAHWPASDVIDTREVLAWYFCSISDAAAFLERFPKLELADGTTSPTYSSPYLPFGRKPKP